MFRVDAEVKLERGEKYELIPTIIGENSGDRGFNMDEIEERREQREENKSKFTICEISRRE